eukprot:13737103-Heterocapsa_arctica.AAC.1
MGGDPRRAPTQGPRATLPLEEYLGGDPRRAPTQGPRARLPLEEHPPPAEEERPLGPQASEPLHARTHQPVDDNLKYFKQLRNIYREKLDEHSPAHGAVEERLKYYEKTRGDDDHHCA